MKRYNNLFPKVYKLENIYQAEDKARKGKTKRTVIEEHKKRKHSRHKKLFYDLEHGLYKTSKYKLGAIYEPKKRLLFKLNYYPDRIVHHCILNATKDI